MVRYFCCALVPGERHDTMQLGEPGPAGLEGWTKKLQQLRDCWCQHERRRLNLAALDGAGFFSSSSSYWQTEMIKCSLCVFLENNSLHSKRRHFQIRVRTTQLSVLLNILTFFIFIFLLPAGKLG